MTAWKKASEELGELIGEAVSEYDVEFRKMFGSPVYFVNGNMFIGVHGDGIMLRLQEEDQ
ncbi:TfoX/Sxy family protein [Methanococcoides vulcani]|uniref:TfoX/Sxy family protein n=1 Tax=Methanococcoides vulcani TaxID=1353158 RepID=UPI000B831552|nr:TfoX/Sxy family protein [Methanococcoides vulcani]